MATNQWWSNLSERKRRLLIVVGVVESALKLAALIDIKRRPANQIRGPKWAWALAVTLINAAGAVPLSYFALGRRRQPHALPA